VSTALVVAASVVAVALAGLGGLSTALRRRIGSAHLATAALLELLLLVQAVLAVVAVVGGHRPVELVTFSAYLGSVVLLPVAGVLWARTEPTRWAGTVLGVAALAVAVMLWRLLDLWEVTRG
jgi:dolichyl-phosphate-mannose--protein O-mannosyl transferase